MITKKSLFIDAHQNETSNGKAFGFVGSRCDHDYQGWFFTWPRETPGIRTTAERTAVIDSLDEDASSPRDPQIPYRWARQRLESYLRTTYDLRRKDLE